jgi:hypothetical protein
VLTIQNLKKRFFSSLPLMAYSVLFSSIFICFIIFLHVEKNITYAQLTRDPVSFAAVPIYTGFLSQIGVFFWACTAAICFFSSKILSIKNGDREIVKFLYISGFLTLILGIDDLLLLHEKFFPIWEYLKR